MVLCCLTLSCSYKKSPYTHNLSKLRNSRCDVLIWSHWCLVQGAACRMAALSASRGRHSGYICLSGFFQRFSKKQLLFCSLQTRSFSWWMSFTTRGPILNPTKTENEFPSKGKPQIPEKTSQQWRLKTYRDHTRTESFMKTSTEDFDNFLMTSDRTFRCLGVRTSLQLRARCHCHLGPWSPNAGATLKTPQKNHETRIECNKFHEDKPYEMHCN